MDGRLLIELNSKFKSGLVRRRREFMEHLIKALNGNEESREHLTKFGVSILSETYDDSRVVVNVDGDTVFRR